jgi:hypothetical protein
MNKENKKRYTDLYLKYQLEKYPSFKDKMNCIPSPKLVENGSNSLTKLIVEFININGYQAERISTTGRMLDNTKVSTDILGGKRTIGSVQWIKGNSTKGSADISATIKGRSIKIEVKWGADRQSEIQKKYQSDIERAGGIYFIAKSFDEFINFYDTL